MQRLHVCLDSNIEVVGTVDYDYDEVVLGFNDLNNFKNEIKNGIKYNYKWCCILQYSSEVSGHIPVGWLRGKNNKTHVSCSNCFIYN